VVERVDSFVHLVVAHGCASTLFIRPF
jgi:hypothetical protein